MEKNQLKNFADALKNIYILYETRKPFFPEKIYNSLIKLRKVAWREAIQYRLRSPDPENIHHFDSQYWEKAQENAEKISQISDEVIEEIRKRIKQWEKLDFDT